MDITDKTTGKNFKYNQYCTIRDIYNDLVLCPANMGKQGLLYIHPSRLLRTDWLRVIREYRAFQRGIK
jgi:hypothetical protein